MKTLSASLEAHYAQQTTTIATCWKATRRDNQVFGFTNHDRDINFQTLISNPDGTGGLEPGPDFDYTLYQARGAYTRTDIASNSNLDVDNHDIDGMFDSEMITEEDLKAGLWDGCLIEVFEVNWADLSMGKSKLRKGRLGQCSRGRNQFHAELLGLSYAYTAGTLCEVTQPGCRATFGDQRCGLNLSGSPSLTVGVGSPSTFVPITYTGLSVDTFDTDANAINDAALTQEDGFFNFGKVVFTSGLNSGLTFEVRYFLTGFVALQTLPPYTVYPGDQYTVQRGCDKKFSTCQAYGNQLNFRGEPHLQGDDLLIMVGRRR